MKTVKVLPGIALLTLACSASANPKFVGCYETNFEKWGGGGPAPEKHKLEVRTKGKAQLEYVVYENGKEGFSVPVRTSSPEELKRVGAPGRGAVEGLSMEPPEHLRSGRRDTDPPLEAIVVIARVVEEGGQSHLVAILPFTLGVLRKVPCGKK